MPKNVRVEHTILQSYCKKGAIYMAHTV